MVSPAVGVLAALLTLGPLGPCALPGTEARKPPSCEGRSGVKRPRPTGITLRGGKAPGETTVRYGWGCLGNRVVRQLDVDWKRRVATVTTWTFGDEVARVARTERLAAGATHPEYMLSRFAPCANVKGSTP